MMVVVDIVAVVDIVMDILFAVVVTYLWKWWPYCDHDDDNLILHALARVATKTVRMVTVIVMTTMTTMIRSHPIGYFY